MIREPRPRLRCRRRDSNPRHADHACWRGVRRAPLGSGLCLERGGRIPRYRWLSVASVATLTGWQIAEAAKCAVLWLREPTSATPIGLRGNPWGTGGRAIGPLRGVGATLYEPAGTCCLPQPFEQSPGGSRERGNMSADPDELRLEAEARYARERLQLYKARTYGSTPTNPARLRALERECARAAARLRRVRTVPESN